MKLSSGNMPDLSLLALHANGPVETPCYTLVPGLEELELYCTTFSPENDWSDEIIFDEQSLLDALSTHKMLYLIMAKCDVRVIKEDKEEDGSDICRCSLCIIFGPNAYWLESQNALKSQPSCIHPEPKDTEENY